MKPFNLKEALEGAEVVTRDGRTITNVKDMNISRIHSAEHAAALEMPNGPDTYIQGILATIHNTGGLHEYPFYYDGGAHKYGGENGADLFMKD